MDQTFLKAGRIKQESIESRKSGLYKKKVWVMMSADPAIMALIKVSKKGNLLA